VGNIKQFNKGDIMSSNQTMPCINSALVNTTALVITPPQNMQIPGCITLKSAAATRLIEISFDNGVEYFTPAYDVATTTMISVIINAPITNIRITGAAGDAYLVS
jgi:hypothetical protein